jgi:hypothetical protein
MRPSLKIHVAAASAAIPAKCFFAQTGAWFSATVPYG